VSKKNKHDEELDLLMSFLAESVAQMSDEQIKEEYGGESGSRTKEIFSAAVKDLRQQKLRDARARYEVAARNLSSGSYRLPDSESARRDLLGAFLSRQSDLRSVAFTVQNRELKDLTDADIETFLKQLADLGLLDAFLKEE
jgi:hypothetical protein